MWTIAIILGLIGMAGILIFLAQAFAKEYMGIKTLLIMFGLGLTIVVSQASRLIVSEYAVGTAKTNLNLMTTSSLIVTVILFSFFILYYLITYTISYFKALKEVKRGIQI